ncbi:Hypothetical protein, predicted transmembrane protein [Mycoplasma yeatsii 13926]|uniref:Uncharacterized protein n=1 Tax=Mycoplasma yeatsii 13926 TaxID=1188240 RepID=S6G3J8_9MOLU|nr:hypothetical protein [Mycoplasma yeatsii]EOA07261.1 Hypothetical protein, predicted transmembrane protein [Mycoplasma yeatsii 13926]
MLTLLAEKPPISVYYWILGIGILVLLLGIFLWVRYRSNSKWSKNDSFEQRNRTSQTVWEFTKKNFPVLVVVMGVIFIVTSISVLVN